MGCQLSKVTRDIIETPQIHETLNDMSYTVENVFSIFNNCEDFHVCIYSFVLLEKLGIHLESLLVNKTIYYIIACISDKMMNDEPFSNKHWAKKCELELRTFNTLEAYIMQQFGYRTQISMNEFELMHAKIDFLCPSLQKKWMR